MANEIHIVSLAPTHAIATWRNVVIQLWELEMDHDLQRREFLRILQLLEDMKPSTGPQRPLLCATIVSERAPMPDADTRRIASQFPAWFDYYVGVHEGAGFRSSMVRAVVSGMALAARVKARYDVCGDVRHGAALLSARSAGTLTTFEVLTTLEAVRARSAALR